MDIKILIGSNSLFKVKTAIWSNQNDYEYEEDYKIVIRKREVVRIPFLHHSPQIDYRKSLVEYLSNYAAKKRLSISCLHLSVYIMDIFMDNHAILAKRLHLVANVCLLLAAKFEENSANIPKLDELNSAVGNRYPINDYKVVEIIILKFFHWYLMLPTAAHYTHYFMQAILTSEDFDDQSRTRRTLMYELNEHVKMFLDKIISDIHFMQLYLPSQLAAAIIAASRKKAGLCSWTGQLQNFTEYSMEQIYEPIQALRQFSPITCTKCTT